jgi:hypothetical protein
VAVVRVQEAQLSASTIAVDVFLQENLTERGMKLVVARHDSQVLFNRSPLGEKINKLQLGKSRSPRYKPRLFRRYADPMANVITAKVSKFTVEERIKRNPGLWDRVKREVRDLICGTSKKYADLRRRFAQLSNKSQSAIVSIIAAAIGANLGVAAGILVPLIALALAAFLAVGKNAYCSGTPKRRAKKKSVAA